MFEQSPTGSQLFGANKSCRGQIEALAAHTLFRLLTTGLGAVGKKVGASDLALDEYGVASALPANGVRHLAASAGLFGEHHSTAIAAKPADSFFDQLGVSHELLTLYPLKPADGSDCGASGIAWPLTDLNAAELDVVKECLRAVLDGPFFPNWELHALFGLERAEVRKVLQSWPELNQAGDTVAIAINNSFNNLLGYPVPNEKELWPKFLSVKRSEVARMFDKWKGRPPDCSNPRDYFDDLP